MAANEEARKLWLQEIEDAERTGVNPKAHVWPVVAWKAGDREIIQIADNSAWCQACGSLMVAPTDPRVPPSLASVFGEWLPSFRCATCYEQFREDECCHCGGDISEGPSWPEPWPRKMCDSCWRGLVTRD